MLSRTHSLKRPLKSREANKASSPTLLIASARNTFSYTRFLFIVSKKIDKRATVRNSIRRTLAGKVKELYSSIEPGFDVVIAARREITEAKKRSSMERITNPFKATKASAVEKSLLFLIDVYHVVVGPAIKILFGISNECRYSLSCSMYTKQAVVQFGVRKGLLLSARRLYSCR